MRALAFLLLLSAPLLCTAQPDVGQSESRQYRIESAVWCSGELRGEPELLLQPGVPGTFEIHSPESSWRLSVGVEPPGDSEGARAESLWFKVGIEQMVDGEWEFLTDTMLGTPLGEPGVITVVDEGQAEGPETASLYVELTAQRVDGE